MEGIELFECLLNEEEDDDRFVGIFELPPVLLLLGGIISMGMGVKLVASEWCSERKLELEFVWFPDEPPPAAEFVLDEEKGFLLFSFAELPPLAAEEEETDEDVVILPCKLLEFEDTPPNVMLPPALEVDRFWTPWLLPWWWAWCGSEENKLLELFDEPPAPAVVELRLLLLDDDDEDSLVFDDFDDFSRESREEENDVEDEE